VIGCASVFFAALLIRARDPQDAPRNASLDAAGDRIESCLHQLGIADEIFADALSKEMALPPSQREGDFWTSAGPLKIKLTYPSLPRDLEPGRTLLSVRKHVACANDKALLDRVCTNELPLLAAAVAEVLSRVESAKERVKAMTVSDAEKPIREKVGSTGDTLAKELESLRDSIREAMRDAPIPDAATLPPKTTTNEGEPLALSAAIERANEKLVAIDARIAELCKEFRSKHFSDFTNPFTSSGGPFRLGTFEGVRRGLRPLAVLTSCRSALACDADRVLLAPSVSAELEWASSMVDGHVEAQRRAHGVLAALDLHDDDASLRDRTLKAGDNAIAELESLRERVRTELHGTASAK
jgi:hypothetical protein